MTEELFDEEQNEKKKKGGDETDSGHAKRVGLEASEAAMADMRARGFTVQQIKEILHNWKHLDGKEVAARLAEFSKNAAKASAHLVVSFSQDAGYALVTNFLKAADKVADLYRKMAADHKHRHDPHNDLG